MILSVYKYFLAKLIKNFENLINYVIFANLNCASNQKCVKNSVFKAGCEVGLSSYKALFQRGRAAGIKKAG